MVSETINAARALNKKMPRTIKTSTMPRIRFRSTVLRGFLDQLAAVVIRQDLDVLREHVIVQLLGHLLDLLQHHLGLLAHAHQDDAFDRIVLVHESELAQPRRVPDLDFADVADVSRDAVVGRDHNVRDVFRRLHQSQTANVIELPALRIESAAGVGVVAAPVAETPAEP